MKRMNYLKSIIAFLKFHYFLLLVFLCFGRFTVAESSALIDPYDKNLFLPTPHTEIRKYIFDIIEHAKREGLFIEAKSEYLDGKIRILEEEDNVLKISYKNLWREWEKFSHHQVEFIPKNIIFGPPGISIQYRNENVFYRIYDKSLELWFATVIAQAKRLKTGVKLNMQAIGSPQKQEHLRFSLILKLMVRKPDIADMAIVFD